jgi:hypothetical protein
MVCSNKRVKSKFERHPSMIGPNRSSFMGPHVVAMFIIELQLTARRRLLELDLSKHAELETLNAES